MSTAGMSTAGQTAAVLLLGAAVVIAWPATTRRARRRAVLAPARSPNTSRLAGLALPDRPGSAPGGRIGTSLRALATTSMAAATASPGRLTALASAAGGLLGAVLAGPVAAIIGVGYAGLATHLVLRRRAGQIASRQRRNRLDQLGALAADLRAGLPLPATTTMAMHPDRIDRLVQAAGRLADRTGAPLADLLDRIEADARATDRGQAAAAAAAAGAQATAWLLALLPLGGIALGFAIGVDPVGVLLYTPVGAACAIAALLLQIGGLAWANRLSGSAGQAR